MNCISCSQTINPAWKHAVKNNICPMCGETIMKDEVKNNLLLLEEVFESMKDTKDYLTDWLNNAGYLSKESQEFKDLEFNARKALNTKSHAIDMSNQPMPENITITSTWETKPEQVGHVISTGDQSKTNEIMKRAGVDPEKAARIKSLVKTIEKSSNHTPEEYLDQDEEYNDDIDDMEDEDSDIPRELLANSETGNSKDLARLRQLQLKQKKGIQTLRGGGSGNPNGFTR